MYDRADQARFLVARLSNLHEISRTQGEILAFGEDCVEALAALLLSEPSAFPEPRVAAAECLAAIGGQKAITALIQVLDRHPLGRLGPVQRFAEETVRNAAARCLSNFPTENVADALLAALRRDRLIGAGEALAHLGDLRAVSHLIECLEDDYKKEKATASLIEYGRAAVPLLCEAVVLPRYFEGVEPPLSIERRARAAELLGQLKAAEAMPCLEIGRADNDPAIRIACCIALVHLGRTPDEVLRELIAGLEDSDFALRKNCEEALASAGAKALPVLTAAARGESLPTFLSPAYRPTITGRLLAIKLLGMIPDTAAALCLISQLEDPNELVRYRTVAALGHFHDADVRSALARIARRDPSGRIRSRARDALNSASSKSF